MISRRVFLQVLGAAGAGLTLGGRWLEASEAGETAPAAARLTPWLRIGTDGVVTVFVARAEFGQRVRHASALLVAEELEADWATIRVEPAPVEPEWAELQSPTTTSRSMLSSWQPLRQAGAAAREMLVAAAARRWGVRPSACKAVDGAVSYRRRRLGYGELAAAAATLPVPAHPTLKLPSQFRYIGHAQPSVDARPLLTKGGFGADARPPGLVFAVLARHPVPGATLAGFDAAAALRVPGVQQVFELQHPWPSVAVVAADTWSALRGRDALAIRWNQPQPQPGSAQVDAMMRARLESPPKVIVRDVGGADARIAASAHPLRAEYQTPYLAHATMEPMNCTAHLTRDRCEVWVPTQSAAEARELTAQLTGLAPAAVTVHPTLVGGAFGRRTQFDFLVETVEVARKVAAPVQLIYTRTDDLRHGSYHPAALQRLAGALDDSGMPAAFVHEVVGAGGHQTAVWGGLKTDVPYAFPASRLTASLLDGPLRVAPWRSVSRFHVAFARESFIDELAAQGRRDPLELRLALLGSAPRLQTVLRAAAKKIGWGRAGVAHGIAADEEFGTVVALAVELEPAEKGPPRLRRIACVVDCGTVIDPRGLAAQLEGGIVFGLSAALHGEITLDAGQVREDNFDGYRILRMDETPELEVDFIPSADPPTGAGEIAVPVVAPALCNAIFAATGQRLRRLPLRGAVARR